LPPINVINSAIQFKALINKFNKFFSFEWTNYVFVLNVYFIVFIEHHVTPGVFHFEQAIKHFFRMHKIIHMNKIIAYFILRSGWLNILVFFIQYCIQFLPIILLSCQRDTNASNQILWRHNWIFCCFRQEYCWYNITMARLTDISASIFDWIFRWTTIIFLWTYVTARFVWMKYIFFDPTEFFSQCINRT